MDALSALMQLAPGLTKMATDLVTASDTVKRNAQLIEFQNAIIGFQSLISSVQQENATLVQQKRDTEKELMRVKDWESQKQRYHLAAPFPGCMVFALKKDMSEGQPAHYLCAACFHKGQPSILQSVAAKPRKEGGRVSSTFDCSICGSEAFTSWGNPITPEYFEDIKPQT